jgi:hypothetical protein
MRLLRSDYVQEKGGLPHFAGPEERQSTMSVMAIHQLGIDDAIFLDKEPYAHRCKQNIVRGVLINMNIKKKKKLYFFSGTTKSTYKSAATFVSLATTTYNHIIIRNNIKMLVFCFAFIFVVFALLLPLSLFLIFMIMIMNKPM